jgi:transposase
MLSRVDLFERIRRDRRVEPGVSVRELSRRHGVHRRTVREALVSAMPPGRQKPARTRALVLEPVMGWIDEILREDLAAPREQRHTVRRLYDRMVVERGISNFGAREFRGSGLLRAIRCPVSERLNYLTELRSIGDCFPGLISDNCDSRINDDGQE